MARRIKEGKDMGRQGKARLGKVSPERKTKQGQELRQAKARKGKARAVMERQDITWQG
jgi:hypothetical protein